MEIEHPPLLVRLYETSTRIRTTVIKFPYEVAASFIWRRLARPIGDMNRAPDVIVSEDEIEDFTGGLTTTNTIHSGEK